MTDVDIVKHYEAIKEIRLRIGGWFGDADKLFARHSFDLERAKAARKLASESFVTIDEITELSLGFFHKKGIKNEEFINEELGRIIKFFSVKL